MKSWSSSRLLSDICFNFFIIKTIPSNSSSVDIISKNKAFYDVTTPKFLGRFHSYSLKLKLIYNYILK
jgi:hypothetical protein